MEKFKTITFKHVVGMIVMIAFLSGHLALLFKPIPIDNKDPFIHSLGMLDAAVSFIVGYYYGSSSGSKTKSEVIHEELDKKNHERIP